MYFLPCNSVALLRDRNWGFSCQVISPPESLAQDSLHGAGGTDAQAISEAWINEFQINQEPGVPGRAWAEGLWVLREVSQGLHIRLPDKTQDGLVKFEFQ